MMNIVFTTARNIYSLTKSIHHDSFSYMNKLLANNWIFKNSNNKLVNKPIAVIYTTKLLFS